MKSRYFESSVTTRDIRRGGVPGRLFLALLWADGDGTYSGCLIGLLDDFEP